MNIVLVIWKIKKRKEKQFLDYWSGPKTKRKKIKDGLFREFLSKLGESEINTWDLTDSGCITYINVGIWKNKVAFQKAIDKFLNEPIQPFEAKRRRRVALEKVKLDRSGNFVLPPSLL